MAIYDCFQYFNEDHMVDLRMNILDEYVDFFVISESTKTHQGDNKKLNFDIGKFKKYKHKIIYTIADFEKDNGRFVICDFVCPTIQTRKNFEADITIWMDTIKKGRFDDTNQMFVPPERYDVRVTEKNSDLWALKIKEILLKNTK